MLNLITDLRPSNHGRPRHRVHRIRRLARLPYVWLLAAVEFLAVTRRPTATAGVDTNNGAIREQLQNLHLSGANLAPN